MSASGPSSTDPSRAPTPSSAPPSRFTSQGATAEDLLKDQTVGLVHLNDFRKRRAEALEQKEREAHGGTLGRFTTGSGSGTPLSREGASTPNLPPKKKRKPATKAKLSFRVEDDEDQTTANGLSSNPSFHSATPDADPSSPTAETPPEHHPKKKRLGPNASITFTPKIMTKSALLRDAQTREQLRKEFLAVQEAVKATPILIPFVFYDGTNIPGGVCRVKKGDPIWLFLDRSRKVGAEMSVGGGEKEKNSSRREWARVGVDDLMLVRGEIIIPHHYDFYYFIVNKTLGHNSTPLFDYASTTALLVASSHPNQSRSPSPDPTTYNPLTRPGEHSHSDNDNHTNNTSLDNGNSTATLEGVTDDPHTTKVVDRRWYERNKHIFPASVWEEFDPGKDYSKGMRRDGEGNAFFFS